MRIVMDFDGVFTDPSDEGAACSSAFRSKILDLKLKDPSLDTAQKVDSWLGELRARQASQPYTFGWRSEGRVSAFTFEDPFLRNIGLADFMDHLVAEGDKKARMVLGHLVQKFKLQSYGDLSDACFHQLTQKKRADAEIKAWVEAAIQKGHEVWIVSNSSTEKIEEFLNQNNFSFAARPKVRGGAKKFALGPKPNPLSLLTNSLSVDTSRPLYEQALLEIMPDLVIGDVFCLDLALPVRLKREKKIIFESGIFYRQRDYTPTEMVNLVCGRGTLVPEVKSIRDWSSIKL